MQTLAAYRLESPKLDLPEHQSLAQQVLHVLDQWLTAKGVADHSDKQGTFSSQTQGEAGDYWRQQYSSDSGTVNSLTLQEPTTEGHTFVTTVFLVTSEQKVIVFCTLSAKHSGEVVAPATIFPRCPCVIRSLLRLRTEWKFGGSDIAPPKAIRLAGAEAASTLSGYILNQERSLPVVVVSELEGEPIWPGLEEKLALDLAGLCSVVRVDADTSWELNSKIGKSNSCYLGAVRIYWPISEKNGGVEALRSNVWTAERLLSNDADANGIVRFRAFLRKRVMNVAALAVDPPAVIRRIQNEESRAKLSELQQRANSNTEELELARLFVEENEQLKDELEKQKQETARQAARADTAEYALDQVKSGLPDTEMAGPPSETESPTAGEVRFYKKTHSKPSYDVLVRISDCGHNSWQSASKADKAKKGIERLENRSDWSSVLHCGSCQGGGVWKVTW